MPPLRGVEAREWLAEVVHGDVAEDRVAERPVKQQRAEAAGGRCVLYRVRDIDLLWRLPCSICRCCGEVTRHLSGEPGTPQSAILTGVQTAKGFEILRSPQKQPRRHIQQTWLPAQRCGHCRTLSTSWQRTLYDRIRVA